MSSPYDAHDLIHMLNAYPREHDEEGRPLFYLAPPSHRNGWHTYATFDDTRRLMNEGYFLTNATEARYFDLILLELAAAHKAYRERYGRDGCDRNVLTMRASDLLDLPY